MDSRVVAKETKNRIWPVLRSHGFADFTTKTAWRHLPDQIHVVNFQSFNTSLAEGVGCTTFSFALSASTFVRFPSTTRYGTNLTRPSGRWNTDVICGIVS